MKCNLCLKEKKLLKKSHIFPDFLIKSIYNEKHQVVMMDVGMEELKSKKVQSNYWESDLLCADCDNRIISQLERYFEINFHSVIINKLKDKEPPKRLADPLIIEINYNKVKLFFISILWRCSIVNKHRFPKLELGLHQEEFRNILFNNKIISLKKYPFTLFSFINKSSYSDMEKYATILTAPRHYKDEHGHHYRFLFPGFLVELYISNHNLPDFIENFNNSYNSVSIGVMNENNSKLLINKSLNAKVF